MNAAVFVDMSYVLFSSKKVKSSEIKIYETFIWGNCLI